MINTSTIVGNGTPALETANLNTNKDGINAKWWVNIATYKPGINVAKKNAIHLITLVKFTKYLFK